LVNITILAVLLKILERAKNKSKLKTERRYRKYAAIFKYKWIVETLLLSMFTMNYFFAENETFSLLQIFYILAYMLLCVFISIFLVILDIRLHLQRKKQRLKNAQ
jgi:hypothetical protein